MDKFKKIRAEIKRQKNASGTTKTRYSQKIKAEVLKLREELGLSYSQTAQAIGVTPKSIRDWCDDKRLKLLSSPPKLDFKKLNVRSPQEDSSSVVLELRSGAKVRGLSLSELIQVIKDEAS